MLDENADLLPDDPNGEALEARLADRLLALDLPNRAGPVLEKLMKAAPTSAGRAGFGARLAAMRQREDDATGALAALAASDAPDLPPDLVERRSLLLAQSQARRGDTKQALAALAPTKTAAADEARATILERANDWPGAERALADYVAKAVRWRANWTTRSAAPCCAWRRRLPALATTRHWLGCGSTRRRGWAMGL